MIVHTSRPFEFIFNDGSNTAAHRGPVQVSRSASPDLVVTDVAPPPCSTRERHRRRGVGGLNNGAARASGTWSDTIFLRKPGLDPREPATPRPMRPREAIHLHPPVSTRASGITHARSASACLRARRVPGRSASPPIGTTASSRAKTRLRNDNDALIVLSLNLTTRTCRSGPMTAPDHVTRGRPLRWAHRRQPRHGRNERAALERPRLPVARQQARVSDDILIGTLERRSGGALFVVDVERRHPRAVPRAGLGRDRRRDQKRRRVSLRIRTTSR